MTIRVRPCKRKSGKVVPGAWEAWRVALRRSRSATFVNDAG